MRWIDPKEINNWADSAQAPSVFPILIRRLIVATTDRSNLIDFPGGSSVYFPGWDGRINARKASGFVRRGHSGWELGTGSRPGTKATYEFKKRTKNPQGLDPLKSTFVFATPRVWPRKEEWRKKKNELGFWKDVRVLDATDLAGWLDDAKAVGLWLAQEIGKAPQEGATSLEDFWSEWSSVTTPPLSHDLLTVGRDVTADEISAWLAGEPSLLVLEAETREEAVAYAAAQLAGREDALGHTALSRGVVVKTVDAFRQLAQSSAPLVLVVNSSDEISPTIAIQRGHHVVVAVDTTDSVSGHKARLARVDRDGVVTALVEMGLSEKEARILSHRSSRSIPVIRRSLGALAGMKKPDWAEPPRRDLVPAVLLGKWVEDKDGDRLCLETLAGKSADEVHATLVEYLGTPDTPLQRVGKSWRATSHHELWECFGSLLTSADIDRFRDVVHKTLGVPSPEFELDANERYAASIHGKTLGHSGAVRSGVAETIALMGCRPECATNCGAADELAHIIVCDLLDQASWELWATLGSDLPTLAEAAPEAFLDAFEAGLDQDASPFAEIFAQEGEGIFGRCYHSGLLWALERIAWSDEYFPRAIDLLARLAELDPGGSWGNRPAESLRERFLYWIRASEASDEQRLATLGRLIDRYPRIGWKVLLRVCPMGHQWSSISGSEAMWRTWGHGVSRAPTPSECADYVQSLSTLAISQVVDDAWRWAGLVEKLPGFAKDRLEEALADLEARLPTLASHEDCAKLWEALRNVIHQHRGFPDTKWAMEPAHVEKFAHIYDALTPSDKFECYGWLFVSWPHLPDGDRTDRDAYKDRIQAERQAALEDIISEGGVDSISDFATNVPNPTEVGKQISEVIADPQVRLKLLIRWLSCNNEQMLQCAGSLCWIERRDGGMQRLEEILQAAKAANFKPDRIARIFHSIPPQPETWDRLEQEEKSVQDDYWGGIRNIWGISSDDADHVNRAVRSMLQRGNAIAAARLLAHGTADLDAYVLTLEALPTALNDYFKEHSKSPLNSYDIAQLFGHLDHSAAEPQTIARLEIPFIEFLDLDRPHFALHDEVVSDPGVFSDLVTWSFRRSDSTVEDEEELSENERTNRSTYASQLLRSVKRVPGQAPEGTIDSKRLIGWVQKARELCKANDRLDIGDFVIGELLANSPVGKDGVWPCEEVRDVLETVSSRKIARGFESAKMNLRGVTSRGAYDGGDQERSLARDFSEAASRIASSHPFVARTLRSLANYYERSGSDHDREAEWRDLD